MGIKEIEGKRETKEKRKENEKEKENIKKAKKERKCSMFLNHVISIGAKLSHVFPF